MNGLSVPESSDGAARHTYFGKSTAKRYLHARAGTGPPHGPDAPVVIQ